MSSITISDVIINDNEYTVITSNGDASVFTINTNSQILDLPSWNELLIDLIASQGTGLIGKTITIDTASPNMVVIS